MESSIEMLAAIAFFTTGVSHISQPRGWADFFVLLRGQGVPGVFVIALITLPMGVLIVSFHNVWTGLPAILTVIGWAFCAKCFVYLAAPRVGLAALATISAERSNKFILGGIMMLVLSGICGYSWMTQQI